MPSLALAFDVFCRDRASASLGRIGAAAGLAGGNAERAAKHLRHLGEAMGVFLAYEAGKKMAEMAGDFQQATNVLVTAAGETQSNLAMVRKGIMDIAKGTGTPLKELTAGMYAVEKAGLRGADGLTVLKAAAQGAREEGANLATVTGAMTSVMASYHIPASKSVMVMNEMKTAAGEAKTSMELFSGSLSTVLPIASANHISFAQVAGALASLTQHGTSADEAAQELANTMRNLSAPNMVAIKEMGQLGINSQDVSSKLGARGLAGTLNYLSETVLKKMGPSGKVLLSTFLQSASYGKAAAQMFSGLAPATQGLAKHFIDGSLTAGQWGKALGKLTPQQASLARQWALVENKSRGFNAAIRAGMPGSQTYTEAIKKMTGGANGLNTTLQLTGESTAGTTERIKRIADAAKHAGKNVDGWASTQKLFNVQLDMLRQRAEVLAVKIGTALIPKILAVVHALERWGPIFHQLAPVASAFGHIFSAMGKAIVDSFSGGKDGFKSFADYLAAHQSDIVVGIVQIAHVVLDIASAGAQMAQAMLGQFAIVSGVVADFLDFSTGAIRSLVHQLALAFGGIPVIGAQLKGMDAAMQGFTSVAIDGLRSAAHGAADMALAIGKKMSPAIAAAQRALDKVGATELAKATFRESATRAARAVEEIGKKGQATTFNLHKFNLEAATGSAGQLAFKKRLDDAKVALQDQLIAARNAGVKQDGLNKIVKESRDRLYAEFIQMGFTKTEANKLADAVGGIPKKQQTKYDHSTAKAAKDAAKGVDDAIRNIPKGWKTKFDWDTSVDGINTRLTSNPGGTGSRLIWKAFEAGGYTGNLDPRRAAGIVHGDEHVTKSSSRRKLEAAKPGALDYMNKFGNWPGYFGGGRVIAAGQKYLQDVGSRAVGAELKKLTAGLAGASGAGGTVAGHYHGAAGKLFRPMAGNLVQGIHDVATGFPAIDIGAPVGRQVVAGASGRVVTSMDLRGYEPRLSAGAQNGYRSYGRYIVIDSGKFSTLYAHLSQRVAQAGQTVIGGQRIGLSGSTGHSYGPHLHFGGRRISPFAFGYDNGGLASGRGWMPKNTIRPERVLSPRQTESFDRLVTVLERIGVGGSGGNVYQTFPTSSSPEAAATIAGSRVVAALSARGR